MKRLIYLIILVTPLLMANRPPGGVVNEWQPRPPQPEGESPTPPPVVNQPDSLPPWAFPWTGAGQDDAGYCPETYGWGWRGFLLFPVEGYIQRPFGHIPGGLHAGLDITAEVGTPVIAPTNGTIIWDGYTSSGYGNMVALASSGRIVILGHLSAIPEWLSCGMNVGAGTVVGYVGQSGAATWPHLHLELRYDGLARNPAPWLSG